MAGQGGRLGVPLARVGRAPTLSAPAGRWAGIRNTRGAGTKPGVAGLRRSSPDTQRRMMAPGKQIAVPEGRPDEGLRRLGRIGGALDRAGFAQ